MYSFGTVVAVTALCLVLSIAWTIFDIVLEATGYYWYSAARREIILNVLSYFGIGKETRTEYWKRFGKKEFKNFAYQLRHPFNLFPRKDLENDFIDKVQYFIKKAEDNSSAAARNRCMNSLNQLKKMTNLSPKNDSFQEVYVSLKEFYSTIEVWENASEISIDDALHLIKGMGFLEKCSWIKARWQVGYFTPLIREFIDYAGRGTTIGLFIGFTIALIQGEPFGVLTTAIPVVGAILGASSYLVYLDFVKYMVDDAEEGNHKNTQKIIIKSSIQVFCMYLLVTATALFLNFLYGIALTR